MKKCLKLSMSQMTLHSHQHASFSSTLCTTASLFTHEWPFYWLQMILCASRTSFLTSSQPAFKVLCWPWSSLGRTVPFHSVWTTMNCFQRGSWLILTVTMIVGRLCRQSSPNHSPCPSMSSMNTTWVIRSKSTTSLANILTCSRDPKMACKSPTLTI